MHGDGQQSPHQQHCHHQCDGAEYQRELAEVGEPQAELDHQIVHAADPHGGPLALQAGGDCGRCWAVGNAHHQHRGAVTEGGTGQPTGDVERERHRGLVTRIVEEAHHATHHQ